MFNSRRYQLVYEDSLLKLEQIITIYTGNIWLNRSDRLRELHLKCDEKLLIFEIKVGISHGS